MRSHKEVEVDTSGRIPWAVLGIADDACIDDARRAFRRLAKSLHPDVGGDARAFAQAVDAFRAVAATAPRRNAPATVTPYDWAVGPVAAPVRVWAEVAPKRPAAAARTRSSSGDFSSVLEREIARLVDAA